MVYEYDGTFFGFLSALFDGYYDGVQQITAITASPERDLFSDVKTVDTNPGKAGRIIRALQEQCGMKACHYLYYGFMAEEENRETWLLRYIRLAFHYKREFLHHLSEEPVWKVRQMARRTGNERHKLLGLLRFRELSGGLLYAPVAPTCCVVPLMAPHFAARLSQDAWVIHDVKRGFAVVYDKKSYLSSKSACVTMTWTFQTTKKRWNHCGNGIMQLFPSRNDAMILSAVHLCRKNIGPISSKTVITLRDSIASCMKSNSKMGKSIFSFFALVI